MTPLPNSSVARIQAKRKKLANNARFNKVIAQVIARRAERLLLSFGTYAYVPKLEAPQTQPAIFIPSMDSANRAHPNGTHRLDCLRPGCPYVQSEAGRCPCLQNRAEGSK